jgi:hypothetical protein
MNHTKEENLNQRDREGIESTTGGVDKNDEPVVSESSAAKAAAFQKLLDSGMADAISRRANRPLTHEIVIPKPRMGTQGLEQNPWEKSREPVAPSPDAPADAGQMSAESGAEVEEVPQSLMDERPQIAEEPPHANDEPPQTEELLVEATAVIAPPLETPVEEFSNTVEAHKEELRMQENINEDTEPQVPPTEEEAGASAGSQRKRIEVTPLGAGLLGIVEDAARGVGGLGYDCARWLKKNYMPKLRKADNSDRAEQGSEEDYPWREGGPQTGPSTVGLGQSASSAVRVTEMVASSVMSVGAGVGKVAGYVARGAAEGPVDIFRYTWKTVACVTGGVASRLGFPKRDSEE